MTQQEALDLLKAETAAGFDPKLSDTELESILLRARLADTDGRAPSDEDWEPTYDLNRAAAHGWRLKAGKCANHHGVTMKGRIFAAQQVYEHCLQQEREYKKRIGGTITVKREYPANEDGYTFDG
jgi:hypothetical protein